MQFLIVLCGDRGHIMTSALLSYSRLQDKQRLRPFIPVQDAGLLGAVSSLPYLYKSL